MLGLNFMEKFHDYSTTEHVQAEIAEQITNVTYEIKKFATLVLYLSLVIGALIEFRNKVQVSSPDSSDNFFFLNSSIHYINCETHLKELISERARRV
jgi:hypothetical protein